MEPLETVVQKYVKQYIHASSFPDSHGMLFKLFTYIPYFGKKVNPELWMVANRRNRNLSEELSNRFEDEDTFYEAINIAAQTSNIREGGLALGYLAPHIPVDEQRVVASPEFVSGLKDGQIYRLKITRSPLDRLLKKVAFFGIGAGMLSSEAQTNLFKDEATYERFADIRNVLLGVAGAAFVYGNVEMFRTSLLSNDENISRRLVTNGGFKMHRNPFYVSVSTMIDLAVVANFVLPAIMAERPNYIAAAAATIGALALNILLHRNAIRDEAVLEKTFGTEYTVYKAQTPRYFPAFWNFFRGNRREQ